MIDNPKASQVSAIIARITCLRRKWPVGSWQYHAASGNT